MKTNGPPCSAGESPRLVREQYFLLDMPSISVMQGRRFVDPLVYSACQIWWCMLIYEAKAGLVEDGSMASHVGRPCLKTKDRPKAV
jgi:hypothetical protein